MITIKKLSSLRRKTALRKAAALLQGFEADLAAGGSIDTGYVIDLAQRIIKPSPELVKAADEALLVLTKLETPDIGSLRRVCNDLRYSLYGHLGISPADWDFMAPAELAGGAGPKRRIVLPFKVFLEDFRSPFNVGSVFRSAESFCVERILLSPSCPRPDSPRSSRSAMGCDKIIPWTVGGLESIDSGPVFALETGGIPLRDFDFPDTGTVILGNEELGVSPRARSLALKSAGIVSIPLHGIKGSLNVTAAFAILIHFWSMGKL